MFGELNLGVEAGIDNPGLDDNVIVGIREYDAYAYTNARYAITLEAHSEILSDGNKPAFDYAENFDISLDEDTSTICVGSAGEVYSLVLYFEYPVKIDCQIEAENVKMRFKNFNVERFLKFSLRLNGENIKIYMFNENNNKQTLYKLFREHGKVFLKKRVD